MKKNLFTLLAVLPFMFLSVACKKEEDTPDPQPDGKPALQVPSTYSSDNYTTNVSVEAGVRSQMSAFSSYMKKGDVAGTVLSMDTLNTLFSSGGSPTLKSLTQVYYANRIEGANGWMASLVTASGNDYDPATPNTTGGVHGGRLLDKGGAELLQFIEKGMFEATMYNHLLTLAAGPITEATVDRMISIYGASPAFPNTSTAANTPTPDAFIAVYAARRDKNDGSGIYTHIKNDFLKLQAAVKAGEKYTAERDQAVASLKLNIEKAVMATVIHYIHTGIAKLSATAPTPTIIANGLHDFSEAIGFTYGFKAIPQSERKITDAQIDQILNYLNAPAGGATSLNLFVSNGAGELPDASTAKNLVQSIYGFTNAEVEDFKQNWISIQGR
jgi:hypothetical protein